MAAPSTTRDRLLDVAGEIFAERGYRGTTIRAIVRRAGANLAAVTYHFEGKAGLYAAVLQYALREALTRFPVHGGVAASAPVERRFAAFVRALCHRVLDDGRPAWHGKLMAREMAEPGPALDVLVAEVLGPIVRDLRGMVREMLGPHAADEAVLLAARSVLAQCVYYRQAAPILARLGGLPQGRAGINRVADHVTRFSLDGLRGAVAHRAARRHA